MFQSAIRASSYSTPPLLVPNKTTFWFLQLRKADVSVQVVDGNNNPVAGASVQITQTRTSFPFGGSLQGQVVNTPAYQSFFTTLFNTAGKFGILLAPVCSVVLYF